MCKEKEKVNAKEEKKEEKKCSTGKKILMFALAIPAYYIVKDLFNRTKK